jgi:hypothetical protein
MDETTLNTTLTVLLKHEADVQRARGGLESRAASGPTSIDRYSSYDNDPRRRKR